MNGYGDKETVNEDYEQLVHWPIPRMRPFSIVDLLQSLNCHQFIFANASSSRCNCFSLILDFLICHDATISKAINITDIFFPHCHCLLACISPLSQFRISLIISVIQIDSDLVGSLRHLVLTAEYSRSARLLDSLH